MGEDCLLRRIVCISIVKCNKISETIFVFLKLNTQVRIKHLNRIQCSTV